MTAKRAATEATQSNGKPAEQSKPKGNGRQAKSQSASTSNENLRPKGKPKPRKTANGKTASPAEPAQPLLSLGNLTHHQQRFLSAYAEVGCITRAAQIVGLSRQQHYEWLRKCPEYQGAFEEANEVACDALVQEARRRALLDSDTLMIFLLKSMRPEIYRDNYRVEMAGKVDHGGKIDHQHQHEHHLNTRGITDEQRLSRLGELAERIQSRRTGLADAGGTPGVRPADSAANGT